MLSTLTTAKNTLRQFVKDEEGMSATEYAFLFVVILAFIIAGANILGPAIQAAFERGAAAIP